MNTKIKLTEDEKLRNENKLLRNNVNELLNENLKLKAEAELTAKLHSHPKSIEYEYPKTIDFGIGKVFYHVHKDSTIVVHELMEAINKVAMITPPNQIIAKLKSLSRF